MAKTTKEGTRSRGRSATKSKETNITRSMEPAGVHSNIDSWRWPRSTVPYDATISKGHAQKQYRLNKPSDFGGLSFHKTPSKQYSDMHLYLERDIERRAWERHGGPEKFDAYLEGLYQRHVKLKGTNVPFTQPRAYGFGCKGRSSIPFRDTPSDDHWGAIGEFTIKRGLETWLSDAFCAALARHDAAGDDRPYTPRERDHLFMRAERFARTYPPRPFSPLPSSSSVDAVRTVLAQAAVVPSRTSPEWGHHLEGLEFHRKISDGGSEEDEWYDWSPEYLEQLFSALIRVIEVHGLGDKGWQGIRWDVHDKYAETMKTPITFDRRKHEWQDGAAQWLDGRFITEDDPSKLTHSCRNACPAGQRYNAMLPFLQGKGSPYVGTTPEYKLSYEQFAATHAAFAQSWHGKG